MDAKNFPEIISNLQKADIPIKGLSAFLFQGEKSISHSGESYFIPANTKHSAMIKAGYKDITLFNQKDRYLTKDTDQKT